MAVVSEATRKKYNAGSLLSSTVRVSAPFIRVSIGGYSFGVYEERNIQTKDSRGNTYNGLESKYPNYIQSLTIDKINGAVNQYSLSISYPVRAGDDPNFFDKIFSGVALSRSIKFEYGDFSVPNFIYKDEEAIITGVTNDFDFKNSVIHYKVSAISTATLALSGCQTFPAYTGKPSDLIIKLLFDKRYHLTDVFKGMSIRATVLQNSWIAADDRSVSIPMQQDVSVLDYIATVVSYMVPLSSSTESTTANKIYTLTTFEDVNNEFGGPYFKVQPISANKKSLSNLVTYEVDIGYPTANIVTDFRVEQSDNWSIFYDYQKELGYSDYVSYIDSDGLVKKRFAPKLTGTKGTFDESDKSWWSKVTGFPISATLVVQGLLRPAILMEYVKINVWFFGRRHLTSGYYIITGHQDSISSSGCSSTLKLVRVAGDDGWYEDTVSVNNADEKRTITPSSIDWHPGDYSKLLSTTGAGISGGIKYNEAR